MQCKRHSSITTSREPGTTRAVTERGLHAELRKMWGICLLSSAALGYAGLGVLSQSSVYTTHCLYGH